MSEAITVPDRYPELHPALSHLDRAILPNMDEYLRYFNLLSHNFRLILATFSQLVGTETLENQLVRGHLEQFLNTIDTLKPKHLYAPDGRLRVDLSASGFPNHLEVSAMETDFRLKAERLAVLPSLEYSKDQLVDHLISKQTDSPEILWQIAQRLYYEHLDPTKLFLTFSPGTLTQLSADSPTANKRSYLWSWGCYDFGSNRPYIYLLAFDQDSNREPLREGGSDFNYFLDVIRAEGSRAVNVGILANILDETISWVHPKVLRRLRIGPIYSPLIFRHLRESDMSEEEATVNNLFTRCHAREDEAIVFFKDDTVFSIRQEKRGLIFGKLREIFSISETDADCREATASAIHRTVLLPHHIRQHLGSEQRKGVPDFDKCDRWVTVDDGGEINVISE